MTADVR